MIQTEILEALKKKFKEYQNVFFLLDQLNPIMLDWIYVFYGFSFFLINFK